MAAVRSRAKVMTLTDAAAERVRQIMANNSSSVAGLRIGVKNGGCAGMEYTMQWAEAQSPLDEVVEDKGVKVLIDPKAVLFLLGAVMDFKIEPLKSGFVFDNPNQTSACGCGESVQLKPASRETSGRLTGRNPEPWRRARNFWSLSPGRWPVSAPWRHAGCSVEPEFSAVHTWSVLLPMMCFTSGRMAKAPLSSRQEASSRSFTTRAAGRLPCRIMSPRKNASMIRMP